MLRRLWTEFFRKRANSPHTRLSFAQIAALVGERRFDQALSLIDQQASIQGDTAELLEWRGYVESVGGSYESAAQCFKEGLRLAPDSVSLRTNLAAALQVIDRLEESEKEYDSLIAHRVDTDTLLGAGFVKRRLRKYAEAEVLFRKVVEKWPEDHRGHRDLGDVLCRQGRYLEAWPHWHLNYAIGGGGAQKRPGTLWLGASRISRLRIWCALGYGDYLQFMRFVPVLKSLHPDMIIEMECGSALSSVVEQLSGIDAVVNPENEEATRKPEHHVSVMSLPAILMEEALPLWRGPYLVIRRGPRPNDSTTRRIGLVWAGSSDSAVTQFDAVQAKRNVPLPALMDSVISGRAEYVALQQGTPLSALKSLDPHVQSRIAVPTLRDFRSTMEVLAGLDLLVSVDTSVAHLAGAMGIPTFILVSYDAYWAWRDVDGHSEWYPSVRVFRQRRTGDWSEALAELSAAIEARFPQFQVPEAT